MIFTWYAIWRADPPSGYLQVSKLKYTSGVADCDFDYFAESAVCSMWTDSMDDELNWEVKSGTQHECSEYSPVEGIVKILKPCNKNRVDAFSWSLAAVYTLQQLQ